jgi:hypothetical protein
VLAEGLLRKRGDSVSGGGDKERLSFLFFGLIIRRLASALDAIYPPLRFPSEAPIGIRGRQPTFSATFQKGFGQLGGGWSAGL